MMMLFDLECGICYLLYDAGRRCPRQLRCKHSFCESCLLTLAEESQSGSKIICAFCRHTTPLNRDKLKDNLPVDEDIFSRMENNGILVKHHMDQDEEEPRAETSNQSKDDKEDEEDLPTAQRGKLWRSIKRLYQKIKVPHRRGCITDAEMRDLALMTCYMM